jgi:hypothetical protein
MLPTVEPTKLFDIKEPNVALSVVTANAVVVVNIGAKA